MDLEVGEELCMHSNGTLATSQGGLPGRLTLTTKRLVFEKEGEPGDPLMIMPLGAIAALRPVNVLFVVPTGFVVAVADGRTVQVGVAKRDRWIELIGELAKQADGGVVRLPIPPVQHPLAPVVSWPAIAAWLVAPLCFVPLFGLLPALALLACGIFLAARPTRAEDRRVGTASILLSGLALLLLAVGLLSLMGAGALPEPPGRLGGGSSLGLKVAQVAVLILSVVIHECGHALSAYWAGDPTALRARRLTLNPIRHVDLFGSVILPGILILSNASAVFGWAKPVPVNTALFRRRKLGNVAVSLAGVSANLLLAMLCLSLLVALGAALRALFPDIETQAFWVPATPTVLEHVPAAAALALVADLLKAGVVINLLLMGFNLLPIPPLDGSHVLEMILPAPAARLLAKTRGLGFILLAVLIFSGALSSVLDAVVTVALLLCYFAGALTGLG